MYNLFWHPSSSSYAPMAVLEELGVPYSLHLVDYDGGETQTPSYRKIQPLGLIPALEIDAGGSMFESGAIVALLCDRHADRGLAPETSSPLRPAYLQWLFFLTHTLYPAYNRFYWPARYTASKGEAEGVKQAAAKKALDLWQIIEKALDCNGPWLLGREFSACDIYLQMVTTWHEVPKDLLLSFPRIAKVAAGVLEREPSRIAFDRHNFASGLEGD
jgi:glutathione S-transferase